VLLVIIEAAGKYANNSAVYSVLEVPVLRLGGFYAWRDRRNQANN
jgi:hypothetical protein